MGGHQYGEVASGMAARATAEALIKKLYSPLLGVRPETQSESLQEIVENAVMEAQQVVVRKAPGGGTTLTTALVIGDQITFAHVGDSRAYFIYPNGEVEVITQDHSLVNRLIQLGQLTKEEAAVHPQKNILYRAIGQNDPFRPDIKTISFPRNCTLMICSDGLWGVIKEQEIPKVIYSASSLTEACHLLVEAANAAGGPDNISVLLVQFLE
jgi:protein phosphatase